MDGRLGGAVAEEQEVALAQGQAVKRRGTRAL